MNINLVPSLFALLSPQDAPAPSGGSSLWIPMAIIFAIFWVVMIGPERKKAKAREAMLAGIKKGDRVVMTSGMFGEVKEVRDGVVLLQIADGVRVRFSAAAVQDLVDASGQSLTQPTPTAKGASSDSKAKKSEAELEEAKA